MARKRCVGTGQPAMQREGSVYPYCPACGKEFSAQGRVAQRRFANAWASVPSHYCERERADA